MSDTATEERIEEVIDQGYCLIEGLLSESECEEVTSLLNEYHEKYDSLSVRHSRQGRDHNLADMDREKRVRNLHNKHAKFRDLIFHPSIMSLAKPLLAKGSYQDAEGMILTNSLARSPGVGDGQQLHIDSTIPGCHVPLNIIALWMLDDFTVERGATRIVPGSHRRAYFAENNKSYPDEISLCSSKGSVLVFDGGLWHGGGDKTSSEQRWGIINSYARWWMKPSFDFNRNMPKEVYDQLSDDEKTIFGYCCNPPKDEFTRLTRLSSEPEPPQEYHLPGNGA